MSYNHEQAKAYLYSIARSDKKHNVFFVPLVALSEKNGEKKPFSIYSSKDEECHYTVYINGKQIVFDPEGKEGFGISLKPGNYKIRIKVYIRHALGNAYASDFNFSTKSSLTLRHTMQDPYWQERNFDHTYDLTITENSMKYLCFFGHMHGDFLYSYNNDYYHVKYDDYDERIYFLEKVKEQFGFYDTTYEWLEQTCSYWDAGIKFDYDDVNLSLVSQYIQTPKTSSSTVKSTTSSIKTTTSRTSNDSDSYVGQYYLNYKHGFGIDKSNPNYTYIGEFYYDTIQGFGIYLFKEKSRNTDICIGLNENGKANGFNLYINEEKNANGRIYENNKIIQKLSTIYSFLEEDVVLRDYECKSYKYNDFDYYGQSYCDMPLGFGKACFDDGSIYIGYFRFGQPDGLGIYVYPSKNYYVGYVRKNKLNGYGAFIDKKNNKITLGYFKDDKLSFSI